MDSIIYKYRRLLTEGYNFTNVDEVYEAIKAKGLQPVMNDYVFV